MKTAASILLLLAIGSAILVAVLPHLAQHGAERGNEQMLAAYQQLVDVGVIVAHGETAHVVRDLLLSDDRQLTYPQPLMWVFGILAATFLLAAWGVNASDRLDDKRYKRCRRSMIGTLAITLFLFFVVVMLLPVFTMPDVAGVSAHLRHAFEKIPAEVVINGETRDVKHQLFRAATDDRYQLVNTGVLTYICVVLLTVIGICGWVIIMGRTTETFEPPESA